MCEISFKTQSLEICIKIEKNQVCLIKTLTPSTSFNYVRVKETGILGYQLGYQLKTSMHFSSCLWCVYMCNSQKG